METKIWANSGDSHFLEPADLFAKTLPAALASRMPKSVKSDDGTKEVVYIDGEVIERRLPKPLQQGEYAGQTIETLSNRPPGSGNTRERLKDLDQEGIWGEIVFPSLGMWSSHIKDPNLVREGCRAINDWALAEIQNIAPDRLIATSILPLLRIEDAVEEAYRAKSQGFYAVYLPTVPPQGQPAYNDDYWEPLWSALEETGLILTIHIGTDGSGTVPFRGPGGAVLNYVETTYGGQRATTQLIAGGALDRHPTLKVLISEGGAAWAPFLGDRMNEGYRQHGMFVRPKLSLLPKEYIYRQVYVSFQHDQTAVDAVSSMGYRNVMFGSDYPHMEGTFGHTQKTLHELLADANPDVRHRITVGAFLDLFPHIGEPPGNADQRTLVPVGGGPIAG
ncbi:amidohydrolase family protein [Mycolicibacterium moriokaense]|uniref:Amidohydrolase family protein n=1 Tax=Mycolicibacterium moriokaense TaxID=39691 RepID=A0A318H8U5_9MYCO|nr:amidohydrolase family protein [Mycolicibacterium moriokaense]PXX01664.1 amidohydrolase family protein [Mycolicibacterium moriokaense]